MGNLNEVGIVREEYRDLLRSKPGTGGLTLDEEVMFNAAQRYEEDTVVNTAVAFNSIVGDDHKLSKQHLLRDAITLLDHLDTLGMEVRHKQ